MNFDNSISVRNLLYIALAMFFGVLMVGNAYLIEASMNEAAGKMLGGFVEESLKLSAVLILFFALKKRINPFTLAVAVALSFSFLENVLYVINWTDFSYTFFRIPHILLHVLATLIATAGIMKCEKEGWNKAVWVVPSFLILSALFHLSFNIWTGAIPMFFR